MMKWFKTWWVLGLHLCLYYAVALPGANANSSEGALVTVTNPSNLSRSAETIEVNWKDLQKKVQDLTPATVVVVDQAFGVEVPSQVIYVGEKSPQALLFQVNIAAGATQNFMVQAGSPGKYTPKVYGRQVPERFDDFAWENDRVAFRMYAAALEKEKGNAKGIDVWSKKTTDLVIDKWYKQNDYHVDHGEGVDAYHVGMTLGAGNAAPYVKDALVFPANYHAYEILDKGPIRFTFRLLYNPWQVNGETVSLVKTISLDAGSYLNKIKDVYTFNGKSLCIAAGVTKHKGDGIATMEPGQSLVAYWDKADGKVDNGMIGVGVFVPSQKPLQVMDKLDHLLVLQNIKPGQPFVYYQGGGWSKSGSFPDNPAWVSYLKNQQQAQQQQLKVKLK